MVCFCDLPLSNTGVHLSVYGDYGIGMTKTWAQRNGISPVLYVYDESSLLTRLVEFHDFGDNWGLASEFSDKLKHKFFRILSLIKPYEGNLWRPTGEVPNLRFYDEREWRFVPDLPASKNFFLNPDSCRDETRRAAANEEIGELIRVPFEPSDVKYLIVRREEEIVPLVHEITSLKGSKYNYDDLLLLASRIISSEQIKVDF